MITLIRDYSLDDIKSSINHLLDKASQSEEVRQLAVSIVANKPDPIPAIYDFVKTNVRYTPDPVQVELFTSPIRMAKDYSQGKPLAEDCDGMAILTTALYRSVGISSNVVILDTEGKGLDHAISQTYSESLGRINVDPSDSIHPLGWSIKYYRKVVV